MSKLVIHATTLSLLVGPAWRGVLLLGPSGSGKSDLGLRAIDAGCALISDDYTHLWTSGGALYATAPDTIAGRMEVRGLGIRDMRTRATTRIALAALLQSDPIERMPAHEVTPILGHNIPTIRLNPREASSVSKLLLRLKVV